MKVAEKIKDILSPDDLKIFESAIESMINDKVTSRVAEQMIIKESEIESKYSLASEKYIAEKVTAELQKKTAELVSENNQKLANLEKKVTARLSGFVDKMVAENISDDLLEKVAINEIAVPVLEGIRNVFKKNSIVLEDGSKSAIAEATAKVSKLETQLSESITKSMEMEHRLEKASVFLIISENTNGMTASQKRKVVEQFKDSTFAECDAKIGAYVSLIKEAEAIADKKLVSESATLAPVKKVFKRKNLSESIASEDVMTKEPVKVIAESDDATTTDIVSEASKYFYGIE